MNVRILTTDQKNTMRDLGVVCLMPMATAKAEKARITRYGVNECRMDVNRAIEIDGRMVIMCDIHARHAGNYCHVSH